MAEDRQNKCCDPQKETLDEAIWQCDMCSTNYEAHHECLRQAARESGRRARANTAC